MVNNLLILNEKTRNWDQACVPTVNKSTAEYASKYKKYYCPRVESKKYFYNDWFNNWYFSRETFSWYCGVHADYTTLRNCINDVKNEFKFLDKFVFITLIRDPIKRYISEWNHINVRPKSVGWTMSTNICNKEISCLNGKNSSYRMSIEEFISCKGNMANNRQTRMLADYFSDKKDCRIFHPDNKKLLLENAKQVLKSFKFFALNEYQELNQKLFEKVFKHLKFNIKFEQSDDEYGSNLIEKLNQKSIDQIYKLNELDIQLYEYAKELFFERIKAI